MKVSAMGSYNYFSEVRKATAKAGGTYSESLSNIGNVSSNITLHYFGTEESGNALTAVGFSDEAAHLFIRRIIIIRLIPNIRLDIGIRKEIIQIPM